MGIGIRACAESAALLPGSVEELFVDRAPETERCVEGGGGSSLVAVTNLGYEIRKSITSGITGTLLGRTMDLGMHIGVPRTISVRERFR